MDTKIIPAHKDDYQKSAELIYLAGDSVYQYLFRSERNSLNAIKNDFKKETTLLSYKNAYNLCINNEVVGIILAYPQKEFSRRSVNSAFVIFRNNSFLKYPGLIYRSFRLNKRGNFSSHKRNSIYLAVLAITPEQQSRGYGKMLLEYLLQEIYPQREVNLEVVQDNTNAINLYKKFGFEVTHTSKKSAEIDFVEPSFTMTKRI